LNATLKAKLFYRTGNILTAKASTQLRHSVKRIDVINKLRSLS